MAITSVYQSPSKQQQVAATLNTQTFVTDWSIIETWIVTTNDKNIQPIDVIGATGLPKVGQSYKLGFTATNVVCKRSQPTRSLADPTTFEVQIEYYIPAYTFTSGTATNVKLSVSGVTFQETVSFDKDNKAILNSAGQPFDPAPSKTFYDETIKVSYDLDAATVPFSEMENSKGTVNSDNVSLNIAGYSRSFTARQLKLLNAEWDITYNGSTQLWHVEIEMGYRADGWIDNYLDQGYYTYTSGSGGGMQTIKDDAGNFLNAPSLLDGHGSALSSGGTPVFLHFKIEDETAFSSFLDVIP